MTHKLKALSLALFAIFALSATMAPGSSALSIFDSASTPAVLTGTSENTQVYTLEGVRFECTHAQFNGTRTGTSVNEVSLVAEYATPSCAGPLGSEIHVDFTTHDCSYKLVGTASKTASLSLVCSSGTGVLITSTAETTITGISSTRTGSEVCGPASDTTATYTGNSKITGYVDINGTEGGQTNIEVT